MHPDGLEPASPGPPTPSRRTRRALLAGVAAGALAAACGAAACGAAAGAAGDLDAYRVLRKAGARRVLGTGALGYWLHRDLGWLVIRELERLPPSALAEAAPWLDEAVAEGRRMAVPNEWMAEVLRGRRLSESRRTLLRWCDRVQVGATLPHDVHIGAETAGPLLAHPDLAAITAFSVRDEDLEPELYGGGGGGGGGRWADGTSILFGLGEVAAAARITELRLEPHGLAILVSAPERARTLTGLRRLVVDGGTPTAALLAALPSLRELALAGLGHDLLADVAPYVTELRVSSASLPALLDGPALPRLEKLALDGATIDRALLERLARSDRLPALRSLSLRLDHFGAPDDLAAFLGALALPRLEELGIHAFGTLLHEREVAALAAAPAAPRLRALRLYGLFVGEEAARRLGAAPTLAGLRRLGLARARLTDAIVAALLAGGAFGLEELDLGHNPLGPRGGAVLAAAPSLARLRDLRLRETGLGDAGAVALAGSRHLRALEHLDLTGTELRDEGASALARSAAFPALHFIEAFAGNAVGLRGRCALEPRFFTVLEEKCPRR